MAKIKIDKTWIVKMMEQKVKIAILLKDLLTT
jgi:hypothetical protein